MKIGKSLLWLGLMVILSFGQGLQESLNRPVTLNYTDTPIKILFRIMSKSYNFNYVIGDLGEERVTINMVNTPLRDALNAILLPFGYHYFVQDSILVIKSISKSPTSELASFVYQCRYKSANYLSEYIRPALSENGQIVELKEVQKVQEDNKPKDVQLKPMEQMLLVRDIPARIHEIDQLLKKLDVPSRQILIEVKLIERLIGDDDKFGINWPTTFGAQTRSYPPKDQQGQSGGGSQQEQFTGWFKELPEFSDKFQWGVVTINQLEMFLQFLGSENRSKIVSNPKVTTENNTLALVNVGSIVPIQTVQRSAQGDIVTYTERNVTSFIEVLPKINEDNSITLVIHPRLQEITGYVGSGDFPIPVIATRELHATVRVKNGEAVVLGGLIKETESKVVNKVFLLGDIPILGYFFKHTALKKEKSDLMIVVTPQILE